MIITLIEKLQYEKMQLEKDIALLESKISTYPSGKFLAARNGKYFKWYRYYNKQSILISKKNPHFAEKMVEKNYLMYQLEDMKLEYKALKEHIRILLTGYGKVQKFLNTPSEVLRIFLKNHKFIEDEIYEWYKTPYSKNNGHQKDLIYNTITGEKVRSKSEVIIYTALLNHNIPFHYEENINFGNEVLSPDFTIRHPKTGKKYLWEHFGAMEKKGYRDKTMKKLKTYTQNGYYPTINLITTYETLTDPLDPVYVEKLIEYYFED